MSVRWFLFLPMLLFIGGCSSLLIKSTPPPAVYQLENAPKPESCPKAFKNGVRIWAFTASSPYDSEEMVVAKSNDRVVSSNSYRWVAKPGKMLAQSLLGDLSKGGMFPRVVMGNDPNLVPLELTGHVFEFAWKEDKGSSRAVLAVEVTLTDTSQKRALFRKDYKLESPPFEQNSSATFAKAMNGLAGEFSEKLNGDLCAAVGKQQGSVFESSS